MSKITEAVQQPASLKVDAEAGVIRGVKVCGNRSKNGRLYPVDVLEAAIPLYENTSIYLDHGYEPGDERELGDHFGCLQSLRIIEGELYGDLHYLKSHPQAGPIVERAERFPRNFGLSHDAEIEAVQEGDVQRVTRITGVNSVDLVTRPATNNGIFEQEKKPVSKKKLTYKQVLESLSVKKFPGKHRVLEEMEMSDDPMLSQPIEVAEDDMAGDSSGAIASAFEQALIAIAKDSSLDTAAKKKKVGELLTMQDKLTNDAPVAPAVEEEETDDEEVVAEEETGDEPKKKTATEVWKKRALAAESKLKVSAKDQVIESVCKEQKVTATESLKRILRGVTTREEMVEYLDGGDVGYGVIESQGRPIRAVESDGLTDYKPPKDRDELLARLR
ncbi:hypothetical protein [Blastopirellula retiformator]|uniref:Uncharacterized protein n=1 Tax=Blastopirellula retiformator TaxID=2527970 RepID=A0A5C5UXZ1_9BACT|nr:hypothetical protein [Blastopirellula retiformator]TWT30709.1 hypothetical protein Enr8_42320 [Blastopirellula retiformator]